MVKEQINIPIIAAGGIATGEAMLAAMVLGADGVQIGSRFVTSVESSAHINFKQEVVRTKDGGTELTLKELTPVRLIKNDFYHKVKNLYNQKAGPDQLQDLLGRGRAKKGMFEGDLHEGELEIGQIAGLIHEIKPAKDIVDEIIRDFRLAQKSISSIDL